MKNWLSVLSIILHSFFVVATNLFSIGIAFAATQFTSLSSGRIGQAVMALVINLVIYVLVFKIMRVVQKELIEINEVAKLSTVFLVSLALLPAIFYPMYFLTQGYWSSFENVQAIWPYQMVANGLCLLTNYFIVKRG